MEQIIDVNIKKHIFEYIKLKDKKYNKISILIDDLEKDIFFNTTIAEKMNISFNDFLQSKYSIMNNINEKYKDENGRDPT